MGDGIDQTVAISELIQSTPHKADFVLNEEKGVLTLRRCVKWLGFKTDLEKGSILVPNDELEKLKKLLICASKSEWLPARRVASIKSKC